MTSQWLLLSNGNRLMAVLASYRILGLSAGLGLRESLIAFNLVGYHIPVPRRRQHLCPFRVSLTCCQL